MADYSAEIAQLESLLNSATISVTADGLNTQFDLEHAAMRLAELRKLQGDTRLVKRRFTSIDLGSRW